MKKETRAHTENQNDIAKIGKEKKSEPSVFNWWPIELQTRAFVKQKHIHVLVMTKKVAPNSLNNKL